MTNTTTALTNVRPYSGRDFGPPTTMVIDGDRIGESSAAVTGAGMAVVDGNGGFLLPGLIDAHVHLGSDDMLDELSRFGVTTALDMGSWPASFTDSFRGRTGVTDIRSSGVGATSPASQHATRLRQRPTGGLVANPAEAASFVADRTKERVDYIKVIIDLPGFDQQTVDALVAAAHAAGFKIIAHASRMDAVEMGRRAGVDVLTHAPLDQPIGSELAAELKADGTVIVPTLTMMDAIVANLTKAGVVGPSYEPARASVVAAHRAGVPLLAGTDANTTPGVPASPLYGDSLHDELELLVCAGLSTAEALDAATSLPAAYFGLDDRGRIEPGLRADLVLLDADPLVDIHATRSIRQVWCAGILRR